MDLDQIRAFLRVARRGSFSRAAEELHRTQPAISLKIRSLETELGHQLFERRQRGVVLTPAGEVLQRRAEKILGELETLATELADLSAQRVGRVSLGASDTVCLYLLPRILKKFVQRYPGIELKLFTQITARVLELIASDTVDIGIVTLPLETEGFRIQRLYEDRFVVVFPPGNPLARRRRLVPEDLRNHPIIHLKPDTSTRKWIDSQLEPFGLKEQVRMEVSTIEVIKRMVEVGLGISVLPEMALKEEFRSGRLRGARLWGVNLTRPMGLVYRREKYFSLALTAFVDDLVSFTQRDT